LLLRSMPILLRDTSTALDCEGRMEADLTPLEFYFWGCVKQILKSVRIHNIQQLKHRIREAAESVTPDVRGRVWQEMGYSLNVRRATNGAHIELP
jgi:hypothetical protein